MRLSAKTIRSVTLQAALCFAPAFALLFTALQTDGRGVPETRIPLSADASPYYAGQFRFFTPHPANLYVRIMHRGASSAAEREMKPSDFRVEAESAKPESDAPYEIWSPGSALVWRNHTDTWDADGSGPLGSAVLYGERNYFVGVRRAESAAIPDLAGFEMVLRVEETNQPQRMSAFGVFLTFGSVLSAGVGAALFRRNLRKGKILS